MGVAAVAVCTGLVRLPDRLARAAGGLFGVAGGLAVLGLVASPIPLGRWSRQLIERGG